eukprot:scaffold87286_cov49-Phaeocystis_antarctica.AAC.1
MPSPRWARPCSSAGRSQSASRREAWARAAPVAEKPTEVPTAAVGTATVPAATAAAATVPTAAGAERHCR